jgi:hypothetical protein
VAHSRVKYTSLEEDGKNQGGTRMRNTDLYIKSNLSLIEKDIKRKHRYFVKKPNAV